MAEKRIGENVYATEPMLAKRAIVLQAKLMKVLGPALPAIVKAFSKADDEERALAGVQALNAISTSIDPEPFGDLVEEVVERAQIQEGGKGAFRAVIFDQDFTANLGDVIPVASFVIEAQFGDFFAGLLKSGARKTTARA